MQASLDSSRSARWAYLAAGGAMLLWSSSAAATKGTVENWAPQAMLFYNYLASAIAAVAIELVRRRGRIGSMFRVGWKVYALGLAGLFGYGWLYAEAFSRGNAIEVSLVNYLWPFMIVLFAVLILRERARWPFFAGAAVCFTGVVVLLHGDEGYSFTPANATAYAMAFGCAVVWGLFSTLLPKVCGAMGGRHTSHSSLFVVLACGAAAINYGLRGPYQWPTLAQLAGSAYIGLFTTIGALLLWEIAMRGGRAAVIGLISYFCPLASSTIIWLTRHGEPFSPWALAGAVCITAGAMLPLLGRRKAVAVTVPARPPVPAGPREDELHESDKLHE